MKVTVTFGDTAVVVPCKAGWTVRDLSEQATRRYRRILEQVNAVPRYFTLFSVDAVPTEHFDSAHSLHFVTSGAHGSAQVWGHVTLLIYRL